MTETKTKKAPLSRLACALLALVMAIGICVPTTAFAANGNSGSITISGQPNETYTIYQVFDLTYATDDQEKATSYSYKVVDGWAEFISGYTYTNEAGDEANLFILDDSGYLDPSSPVFDEEEGSAVMVAFAKAALAYAESNASITGTSTTADTEGNVSFTDLPLGWYLVDTSLGSLCMLTSTNPDATVKEKNPTPKTDKEVLDTDNNDDNTYEKGNPGDGTQDNANVGDTVEYKVTISNVAHSSSLCLHDEVTAGLDFIENSIKVYLNDETNEENLVSAEEHYTIIPKSACEDQTCIFEIEFNDEWLDGLDANDVIIVTYEVVVNEEAVVVHGNDAWVTFGADSRSEMSETETDTYGFELKKVDDNQELLNGATFTLAKEGSSDLIVFYYDTDTNTYIVHDASIEEETTTAIVVTGGDVKIFGLEEGTYTLTETKAPDGYNMLSEPINITITQDEETPSSWTITATSSSGTVSGTGYIDGDGNIVFPTLTVENNAGQELPGTGGMGTTIFYIIGGILVVGAVVVLITRRRMNNRA